MRTAAMLAILPLLIGAAPPKPAALDLMIGTFTNEEQVYFEAEAGGRPQPWFAMQVSATANGLLIEEPDVFGALHSEGHGVKRHKEGKLTVLDYGACQRLYRTEAGTMVAAGMRGTCRAPATITRVDAKAITLTYPDGKTSELRRSRPVTCWSAVKKDAPKPDGKEDWYFAQNVKLHDQGGRALIGNDVAGVKPVIIRMRNVTWGQGSTNRPSIVLYIHTQDEPNEAVSYVWADPSAARIGINLRWMQASCTVDGAERASEITPKTFRG